LHLPPLARLFSFKAGCNLPKISEGIFKSATDFCIFLSCTGRRAQNPPSINYSRTHRRAVLKNEHNSWRNEHFPNGEVKAHICALTMMADFFCVKGGFETQNTLAYQ